MIHQTSQPSSTTLWASSDAHVPIVCTLAVDRFIVGTLTILWQQPVMHCVLWHLSVMASIKFLALPCDRTRRSSLCSSCASLTLWAYAPETGSLVVLPCKFCQELTTAYREHPKKLSIFGDGLTQSFTQSTDSSLSAKYMPPLQRCHCNNIINTIQFTCQWF